MKYSKFDLAKIIFVWLMIVVGVSGIIFKLNLLVIIAAIMLAIAFILIKFFLIGKK